MNEWVESGLGEVEALGYPPWVEFLIVVGAVLVLTGFVHLLLDGLLRRLARRTNITFDDELIAIAHRPILITVLVYGLARALEVLELQPDVLVTAQRILYTFLAFVLTIALKHLLNVVIENSMSGVADVTGMREEMTPFLKNLAGIAAWAGFAFVVLVIWDQSIAPIIASAGVAGLAVSFAAKDALANIFGGISIFLEGTYKLGDYLQLPDVAGVSRGEVIGIGLRSTRLRTRDDIVVTVPNSIMANSAIVNQSAVEKFRVRIGVGVAYKSDTDRVERVLLEIANAHPLVLADPNPRLRMRTLGDSALIYELLCWCGEPAQRGRLTHELNTGIHDRFKRENIVIPVPQMEVKLKPSEGNGTVAGAQD